MKGSTFGLGLIKFSLGHRYLRIHLRWEEFEITELKREGAHSPCLALRYVGIASLCRTRNIARQPKILVN